MRFFPIKLIQRIIKNKSQYDTTIYIRKINQHLKNFKNQEINHGQLIGHLSYIFVHELKKSALKDLKPDEMNLLITKSGFWIALVLYLSINRYKREEEVLSFKQFYKLNHNDFIETSIPENILSERKKYFNSLNQKYFKEYIDKHIHIINGNIAPVPPILFPLKNDLILSLSKDCSYYLNNEEKKHVINLLNKLISSIEHFFLVRKINE